ncbi:MAG: class I adenylate-forming enzyme family protein [Candidatus Helarchaeota archaeon]
MTSNLKYPDLDKFDLSSLTLISSGGGKLPQNIKIELLKKFHWTTVIDGYGSTETIGTSTIAFMGHDDIPKIKKEYIGQPVTGMEIRCINEKGEEVAKGEIGEMVFKGKTIMKGYYKDDLKTKSTFDQDGWFHSGDLCYMDEENNVYYVGRKEEMITSGGEKIFPMEIEDVLRLHDKIDDVAVLGIPDEVWGQKVVAFIKLEKGAKLSEKEITEYCKGKIASYKKPRIIKFVSELPTTKTGKLDRIQLGKLAEKLIKKHKKEKS